MDWAYQKHIYNMCTEDRNSTSTKEEAPPIYFQEDLRWGNTTEAGVWMRNMERGPNFKAADLTKNILSTASHFPSSTTETIRLLYTYVIFQNTHAWSPKISAQHLARPHVSLWVQFSQEFLPGAYSQSDIYSYFLLATSNNSVEWFTNWLTVTHHKQQF